MHLGIKKFECKNCLKQFTYQSSLIKHQRIHLGIKKFNCTVCDKKFSQAGHLREHQLIHSGQKYGCKICGKKYRRYDVLKTHEKSHRMISEIEDSDNDDNNDNDHASFDRPKAKPIILHVENLGTTSQYQNIVDAIRGGNVNFETL